VNTEPFSEIFGLKESVAWVLEPPGQKTEIFGPCCICHPSEDVGLAERFSVILPMADFIYGHGIVVMTSKHVQLST
jgi:hypothetical protein